MWMNKQLNTVEEVISELGGYQAVRELTEKNSNLSTVMMWKTRQKFPATTYARMQAALRAKGATAPDDLWGMP